MTDPDQNFEVVVAGAVAEVDLDAAADVDIVAAVDIVDAADVAADIVAVDASVVAGGAANVAVADVAVDIVAGGVADVSDIGGLDSSLADWFRIF